VAGPRPDDADGSVEVNGAVVSVRTLPSPLLSPGAPILVDRAVLIAQWKAWCARRRDELAIAHASGRLDRHRIEVSLEQARARPAAAPEPAPDEAEAETEPSPPVGPAAETDAHAELRVRIAALLDSADAEEVPPLPEAQFLADAWAAHMVLVRACAADDEVPQRELERLEQRVDEARRALADLPQAPPEDVCAHLERSHKGSRAAETNPDRREAPPPQLPSHVTSRRWRSSSSPWPTPASSRTRSFRVLATARRRKPTRRALRRKRARAARKRSTRRMVSDVPTRRSWPNARALIRSRAAELPGGRRAAIPRRELRALRVEPSAARDDRGDRAGAGRRRHRPAGDVVGTACAFVAGALTWPEEVGPV
jgi:hypothetical protein